MFIEDDGFATPSPFRPSTAIQVEKRVSQDKTQGKLPCPCPTLVTSPKERLECNRIHQSSGLVEPRCVLVVLDKCSF
jgi:hypothetical protein